MAVCNQHSHSRHVSSVTCRVYLANTSKSDTLNTDFASLANFAICLSSLWSEIPMDRKRYYTNNFKITFLCSHVQ